MTGALEGFFVVGLVIGTGYLLARVGVIAPGGRESLAAAVYYVGMPALIFDLLANLAPGRDVWGPAAVAAISAAVVAAIYLVIRWRASRSSRLSPGELVIGATASVYVNSANLGLPIAVYVLGDPFVIVPVVLFQVVVLAPSVNAVLHMVGGDVPGRSLRAAALGLANPLAVASVLGLTLNSTGSNLPGVLADSVELASGLAVPGALLAYGYSLHQDGRFAVGRRTDLWTIAFLKLFGQPLVALLLGRYVFGFEGVVLQGVVLMAALPTAQNVLIFASRAKQSVALARDAVSATTLLSLPTVCAISILLTHS